MPLLYFLCYIAQGASLRRGDPMKSPGDAAFIALLGRYLADKDKSFSSLSSELEYRFRTEWSDVDDYVNPFGDERGLEFDSVWIFDLENDKIFLRKEDQDSVAPLSLAQDGSLTLADFQILPSTPKTPPLEEAFSVGSFWEPQMRPCPRKKAISGRLLRDFGHTWRHLTRRSMNETTFLKLAYATLWIATMKFTIIDRKGWYRSLKKEPFVWVTYLPVWDTPQENLFQAGPCWIVLAQNPSHGLEMVRSHMRGVETGAPFAENVTRYLILGVQQVVLCEAEGSELKWTKPETLFADPLPSSQAAIDMILWATDATADADADARLQQQRTALNRLPVEIQDAILFDQSENPLASAILGYKLGLGSPFSWMDGDREIVVRTHRRHRRQLTSVQTFIILNNIKSGLMYQGQD
ncbi:hypothetical protein PWT90_04697 [Aphanocladium album]|nr:hypothetical protein PWT90_04697 [Aphanocladium album]